MAHIAQNDLRTAAKLKLVFKICGDELVFTYDLGHGVMVETVSKGERLAFTIHHQDKAEFLAAVEKLFELSAGLGE